MKCICCEKKIEPIYNDVAEEKLIFEKEERITVKGTVILDASNRGMWLDGIVGIISAGYGSDKDGDQYAVAICDVCLTKKTENGTIALIDNYIIPNSSKDNLNEYRELWKKFNK